MEHDIHMNHSIQLYTEGNTTTCMPTTVNCYQQHTGSLENEGHHTISCWGIPQQQIFHQFHQTRTRLSYYQQFMTEMKIAALEITNLRRCHQLGT